MWYWNGQTKDWCQSLVCAAVIGFCTFAMWLDFNFEIWHIQLENLQPESMSVCLSAPSPVRFFLVVAQAGSNCCKLQTLKATEEEKEHIQEVTMSPAVAKEISTARWQSYRDTERTAPKVLGDVFALLPTCFCKFWTTVVHRSSLQGDDVHLMSPAAPMRSFKILLSGSSWPKKCDWSAVNVKWPSLSEWLLSQTNTWNKSNGLRTVGLPG